MTRSIYNDHDARGSALMELLCVVTVLTYLILAVATMVDHTLVEFSKVVGWD